jgi:hypothetical protein
MRVWLCVTWRGEYIATSLSLRKILGKEPILLLSKLIAAARGEENVIHAGDPPYRI